MATRLRLSSTVAAPVVPDAISSPWNHTSLNITRKLTDSDEDSVITTNNAAYDAADHLTDENAIHGQFVSRALASQIFLAQTIKLQIKAAEATAANNLFVAWKIFLILPSGIAIASSDIVPFRRDGLEIAGGGGGNRGDSLTSSEVTAPLGSHLLLEIGTGGLPTAAAGVNGHNSILIFGENAASDLPEDDTTTTSLNAWVEFANDIIFSVPSRTNFQKHAPQIWRRRAA